MEQGRVEWTEEGERERGTYVVIINSHLVANLIWLMARFGADSKQKQTPCARAKIAAQQYNKRCHLNRSIACDMSVHYRYYRRNAAFLLWSFRCFFLLAGWLCFCFAIIVLFWWVFYLFWNRWMPCYTPVTCSFIFMKIGRIWRVNRPPFFFRSYPRFFLFSPILHVPFEF